MVTPPAAELHTLADDEAVVFFGGRATRYEGLAPATHYEYGGVAFRTLPRPPGAFLATVATVNDVHFGEVECGRVEGHDVRPVLTVAPGEPPYPEVMNRAATAEIAAAAPDLVVVKGDLTAAGRPEEVAAFDARYRAAFAARLMVTRGNHDQPASGPGFDAPMFEERRVDGVVVVTVDTSRPGEVGGHLDDGQLDALDEVAARGDAPVLVFGHHPARDTAAEDWMGEGSALDQVSTDALVRVVARRPAVKGYFAGHTHRNRVRRFAATGPVPFAEVACTKDFPGSWAEYRIYEGGWPCTAASPPLKPWPGARRVAPSCSAHYPRYALGALDDRCYVVA